MIFVEGRGSLEGKKKDFEECLEEESVRLWRESRAPLGAFWGGELLKEERRVSERNLWRYR